MSQIGAPTLTVALSLAAVFVGLGQSYTVAPLGSPRYIGSGTYLGGINSSGHAVGYEYVPEGSYMGYHAFVYSGNTRTEIGGGYQPYDYAFGINDMGDVVGAADSSAFLYTAGAMHDIGTLGGSSSIAYGINDAGQIVGSSYLAGGGTHAFLYSSGSMLDLGSLGGDSEARAINKYGEIAGSSSTGGGNLYHAFLYSSGVMNDLGTLSGSQSRAEGINDNGLVAGWSSTLDGGVHAFLSASGGMTDLGTLGGDRSWAHGLNNEAQVVGEAVLADNQTDHAFLYVNGLMLDLNSLIPAGSGWDLISAQAINDSGEIIGQGIFSGQAQAFILTPVPEPASATLMAVGTMLALQSGRRRCVAGRSYFVFPGKCALPL